MLRHKRYYVTFNAEPRRNKHCQRCQDSRREHHNNITGFTLLCTAEYRNQRGSVLLCISLRDHRCVKLSTGLLGTKCNSMATILTGHGSRVPYSLHKVHSVSLSLFFFFRTSLIRCCPSVCLFVPCQDDCQFLSKISKTGLKYSHQIHNRTSLGEYIPLRNIWIDSLELTGWVTHGGYTLKATYACLCVRQRPRCSGQDHEY